MAKASVKRLIECKKEQLIDLVLDIEKYPDFVPFCLDSKVYERNEKDDLLLIVADLTIGKGPFKDTYKSDVKFNKKKDSIYVTNLDGPLKYLENKWYFKEEDKVTEISFEVDFELKNDFLNIVMTKSFQFGLDKIADAFQKRAEDLFSKT
ncbi:MAG TPA: type II toxin-antitoxin system RatA family toxin [Candidatus Pelagibacter bacterium]|nr:type II toxin-antitoxin system RatA family toxin [Candidatus Pelagibacter bacterium]